MPIKIGNDEFCLHCMEWQEYDEEGKCKVCKHVIHKVIVKSEREGYNEYKIESPTFESEEDISDSEEY